MRSSDKPLGHTRRGTPVYRADHMEHHVTRFVAGKYWCEVPYFSVFDVAHADRVYSEAVQAFDAAEDDAEFQADLDDGRMFAWVG